MMQTDNTNDNENRDADNISTTSTTVAMNLNRSRYNSCALCQYHGNSNVVTLKICTYIEDSISNVHRDEICQQVVEEMQRNDIEITADEVNEHIENHMINKHVILSNVVHDLVTIAKTSKQACLMTNEETGQPYIEHKNAATYFKAVDQLSTILRADAFRKRNDS